jgi:hypothetical protein
LLSSTWEVVREMAVYVAPWAPKKTPDAPKQPDPGYKPLGEKGGHEYDEEEFNKGSLRADLCGLIAHIDYRYAAKIADAILDQYEIKHKPFMGGKPTETPETEESAT